MPAQPGHTDFKPTGGGSPITSIAGGNSFDCEVVLDSTTPTALAVTVRIPDTAPVDMQGGSSVPGGYVQATLTIAANSDTGTLSCSAGTVSSNTAVTFTASANGGSASGTITVTP